MYLGKPSVSIDKIRPYFIGGLKTPHQTRIHVSLSLSTTESLFDLVKYGFWSGEAIPGVRRPVTIRVRTAYSIAAT